jgi:Ca2+-binding RTX toxin-like protein
MALFVGTPESDTITPALVTAGVLVIPSGADLSGDDSIVSLGGDDIVEGGLGNDTAALGDGSDRFIWNPGDGDDIIDGGDGTDTLEFNGSGGAEFMTITTLAAGGFQFFRNLGDITVDATNVEVVEANAGDGDDVIIGSGQTDPTVSLVIDGGGGNDVIAGGAGDDDIEGNTGDDVAFGGDGDDSFAWDPGDGDDTFDGGDGTDTLEFTGSDDAEVMTVTTLGGGGFSFFRDLADITVNTVNVERVEVFALGGNDTVDGSLQTRSDVSLIIDGGAGDDRLTGGAGDDEIEGNTGDDAAFGLDGDDSFAWDPGDGDDTFDGGDGTDTLEFTGSDDAEVMTVTTLDDGGFQFFRDLGDITVDTLNIERVEVAALGGNDVVDGSAQTRTDVSLVIAGGAGNDELTSGAGGDTFVFGEESSNGLVETDTIIGYSEAGGDIVDVSAAGGIVSSQVVGGNLQVILGGSDGDLLIIQGVTSAADVSFVL